MYQFLPLTNFYLGWDNKLVIKITLAYFRVVVIILKLCDLQINTLPFFSCIIVTDTTVPLPDLVLSCFLSNVCRDPKRSERNSVIKYHYIRKHLLQIMSVQICQSHSAVFSIHFSIPLTKTIQPRGLIAHPSEGSFYTAGYSQPYSL